MKTIDLKKKLKTLYTASRSRPALLNVPRMGCIMVEGMGDPNGQAFQESVGALYTVAYTLKFSLKKQGVLDYPVMPLEGLWSAKDMGDFQAGARANWKWRMFIALPDAVTSKLVTRAVADARRKAKFPRFAAVRYAKLAEGKAAQLMHVGPYAAEAPTITKLHRFIEEQGLRRRGEHHEIYLGDPRRTAPEKLKTIIRQSVENSKRRSR